jgi:hypothetical protein
MCIFCGGQCGGVGDLLISLGLPFLAIYFLRLQAFLIRLKKKIRRRPSPGEEMPEGADTCACCGELSTECRHQLSPITPEISLDQSLEFSIAAAPKNFTQSTANNPEGVKGWLFLLCLNLLIIVPAFSLYQTDYIVNMLFLPQYKILLSLWSINYYYLNIAMLFINIGIAFLSFYSGWQLWTLKEGAVNTAKMFLIVQLSLTLVILALQQVFISQSAGVGSVAIHIGGQLITAVLYFIVWYTYLTKSRRVHNTFGPAKSRPIVRYAAA